MTYHSIIRTKERANLNENAARKMILRAKEYGRQPEEFPAAERKYLEHMEQDGKCVVFYSGYSFILGDERICITMFRAPQWFGKKNRYSGKTEIRNAKKYAKMRGNEYECKREIQHYYI